MLTYVFWHQRESKIAREEYQERLVAFHRILRERQPQGFLFSMVLEMAQLPWMEEGSEAYEDWYIIENSAALDPLDEAAVTGICREPHHQVARLAGNGTGGLYRLKGGTIDLAQLAEIAQLSPFHLLRSFRNQVALPPHAYQIQVRILRAKQMLRAGMPCIETAFAVGFADQSHFTKHFKRIVGVTPGLYSGIHR